MDRGAWWAAVHGVTKSQTRLSDFTFTFHFYALEKEMATHSSVLAWRIPRMGEPGGLPSMGSHRVGHDWSDLAAAAAMCVYIYTLHIYHILFICSLNRDKKFSSWTLRNSLTGRDGQGSFRTLEGNSAATDAQKAKQREFTTEIIADQHFPAEKWFAHPLRWMGAGCWGCNPRERTGVECCEDTLKGLVQQSGGSPGKSLGLRLRADSLGRVHDPPQTGATSRRPGLQKALPKHPSYGFHTPLSPWPDWASEP